MIEYFIGTEIRTAHSSQTHLAMQNMHVCPQTKMRPQLFSDDRATYSSTPQRLRRGRIFHLRMLDVEWLMPWSKPSSSISGSNLATRHATGYIYNNVTPSIVDTANHPAPQRHAGFTSVSPNGPRKTTWHSDVADVIWPQTRCQAASQPVVHVSEQVANSQASYICTGTPTSRFLN